MFARSAVVLLAACGCLVAAPAWGQTGYQHGKILSLTYGGFANGGYALMRHPRGDYLTLFIPAPIQGQEADTQYMLTLLGAPHEEIWVSEVTWSRRHFSELGLPQGLGFVLTPGCWVTLFNPSYYQFSWGTRIISITLPARTSAYHARAYVILRRGGTQEYQYLMLPPHIPRPPPQDRVWTVWDQLRNAERTRDYLARLKAQELFTQRMLTALCTLQQGLEVPKDAQWVTASLRIGLTLRHVPPLPPDDPNARLKLPWERGR